MPRTQTLALAAVVILSALATSEAADPPSLQIVSSSASYTHLETTKEGETIEVVEPMTQQSTGRWAASQPIGENGEDGLAESVFELTNADGSIAAKLSHSITSSNPSVSASTNGSAAIAVQLVGGAGTEQSASVLVDVYRTIIPGGGLVGSAVLEGMEVKVDDLPWMHREQHVYHLQLGQNVTIPNLTGAANVEGQGTIIAATSVIVSIVASPATPPEGGTSTPPANPYPELGEVPDPEDDTANDECPGPKGDNLHLSLATGAIVTQVPICRTYANDEIEFDLVLRYDSRRTYEDRGWGAVRARGWSHSYMQSAAIACYPDDTFGWVSIIDSTGRRHMFRAPGSLPRTPPGRGGICVASCLNGNGTIELIQPNGDRYHYSITSTSNAAQFMTDRRGRKTTWTHGIGGTTITSWTGRTLTFQSLGSNQAKITHPDGEFTLIDYDAETGDLIRVTDPIGKSVEFEYDGQHRILKETLKNDTYYTAEYLSEGIAATHRIKDSTGAIVAQVHCTSGFPARDRDTIQPAEVIYTDSRGINWTVRRDNLGRIWKFEGPEGSGFSQGYTFGGPASGNDRNRIIFSYDERHGISESHWDEYGNRLTYRDPEGNLTSNTYPGLSLYRDMTRPTATIQPDGDVWTYEYNAKGDLKTIIDPIIEPGTDRVTSFEYEDHVGGEPNRIKTITETDRNGHVTIREYNGAGNLIKLTRGAGAGQLNLLTEFESDAMGRERFRTVHRGDADIVTETKYDDMGRVTERIEDQGEAGQGRLKLTTINTYDGHGNLLSVRNPRAIWTSFSYDHRNRRVGETIDPDAGLNLQSCWVPDGNGNITEFTDANGRITEYVYDDLNHLIVKIDAENYKTLYTPDPAGQVLRIDRALTPGAATTFHSIEFAYDILGRKREYRQFREGGTLITYYDFATPGSGSPCSCNSPTPGTDRPWKITDPQGRVTYFNHDHLDRLVSVVRKIGDQNDNPLGDDTDSITRFDYDFESNVKAIHGPEGQLTAFDYDQADRLRFRELWTSPTTFLTTRYEHDGADNPIEVELPTGNVLSYTYDHADRLTQIDDSFGRVRKYVLDSTGNVMADLNGLNTGWSYVYDAADRLVEAHDPIVESPDLFTTYEYDKVGNMVLVTDNRGVNTKYQYDAIDRLTGVAEDFRITAENSDTENTWTTFAHNGAVQTSIADHNGNTTTYEYTDDLTLKKITYPSPGGVVEYEHNFVGKVTKRTDQRGIQTSYGYDDLYNLSGRSYSWPNEQGSPQPRSETFVFDRSGRLTSAIRDQENEAHFTYDRANRLHSTTQPFEPSGLAPSITFDYEVDSNGARRTAHYPGGRNVTHSLDGRGRLASVAGGSDVGVTWTHDLANRRTQAVRPNGVRDTFGYDAGDRLTSSSRWLFPSGGDPSPVDLREYGYNAVGNRMFTRLLPAGNNDQTARSELYFHDNRNRLRSMLRGVLNAAGDDIVGPTTDADRASAQSWTGLDPRGNWTEFHELPVGLPEQIDYRDHNAVNQITEIEHHDGVDIGNLTPTHDLGGNLTFEPRTGGYGPTNGGLRYTYDEENRVTAVRRGGDNALVLEINYDAIGRRVETIEHMDASGQPGAPRRTRHLYDGLQVVRDYVCGMDNPPCATWGSGREYIWGDGNRFPEPIAMIDYTPAGEVAGQPEVFHYLRDVLGSIVGLTDENGVLVERYSYDPYGKTHIETWDATTQTWNSANASPLGNPFLWTGHRYDPLVGLYHTLFRSYAPLLGRWLQQDPMGYTNTPNLYEYVRSAPLAGIDPLGLYGPETHDGRPMSKGGRRRECGVTNQEAPGGTYKAALDAGFTPEEAAKIAACNQGEDENGRDAVSNGILSFFTLGLFGSKQYDNHFPGAGPVIPFVPQQPVVAGFGNAGVSRRVNSAVGACDLCALGRALHTLQDSYSHEGTPDWGGHPKGRCYKDKHKSDGDGKCGPGSKPAKGALGEDLCRCGKDTSQGQGDTGVDDPRNDEERHSKAMRDTTDALRRFRQKCGGGK